MLKKSGFKKFIIIENIISKLVIFVILIILRGNNYDNTATICIIFR